MVSLVDLCTQSGPIYSPFARHPLASLETGALPANMTASGSKTKGSAVKKATKGKLKAEKIFHPESRKAGQMEREALRKAKLLNKTVKKGKKQMAVGSLSVPSPYIESSVH
jgi:hypothetical protein